MAVYRIEFTHEARNDLAYFSVHEQKRIVDDVKRQLTHEPTAATRNRKELRDNPVARWELRIGKYRVFYEVESATVTVLVAAVGSKVHNVLCIRGKEVKL
jgi:mRNA-degrading endonuclease RelE of RelBE toxin-antitoxin system